MTLTYTDELRSKLNRQGGSSTGILKGDAGETIVDAQTYAEANKPASLGVFALTNVEIAELESPNPLFRVTYTFGVPPTLAGREIVEENEEIEEWSTTTTTVRVFTSLETISKTPTDAPDYDKQIAVDPKKNEAEGIDVPVPVTSFTVRTKKAATFATQVWRRAVGLLVGTVNAAAFRGFSAGEVRIAGLTLRERQDGDWDVSFTFEVMPNETNVPVGSLTVATKDGWDVIWPLKNKIVHDETSGKTSTEVGAAYVERVSKRTSFALLGISVS